MAETDALRDANFSSGLFLNEFPAKVRVLTLDPLVYNDQYGNTKYAFVVFNLESEKVQIIDKTSGFANRFKEIHLDEDFGGDIRKLDLKITTNGKQGKEIRYTINPLGDPKDLTQDQLKIIKDADVDLEKIIKKKAPGAIRLSEANQGKKPGGVEEESVQPSDTAKDDDVVIEDIGDEPINLDDIPF